MRKHGIRLLGARTDQKLLQQWKIEHVALAKAIELDAVKAEFFQTGKVFRC